MSDIKKGTNAAVMKDRNIRLILNMVHQNRCSRAEIAKKSGLTKATVTILTEELIRSGLIKEAKDEEYSGVGRCPLKLSLCKNSVHVVGVAIWRKGYHIGLYNLAGEALKYEYLEYESEDCYNTISRIAEKTQEYIKETGVQNVLGIGVASPGPVDYRQGKILNPPNFKSWHNCSIAQHLEKLTGLPVFLENVSNALAINQKYFGICRKEENYAYILVDDGIGSGIVVDGRIYRGKNGYGNELGHTSICYNGIRCDCGNKGCLECYASMPALLKDTGYKSWKEVIDAEDTSLMEKEADYLSCALVSLINLFDLGKIVIGGDLEYKGTIIAEMIKKSVTERIITDKGLHISMDTIERPRSLAGAALALHNLIF